MNKVAFVIPIFPRDYHYLDFIDRLPNPCPFDIYLILSYKSDYDELMATPYNKIYRVCVLEDHFPREVIDAVIHQRGIVTFKKYIGLTILKDSQYDYIATTDCEIEFYNLDSMYEKIADFCAKKTFVGSEIEQNSKHFNTSFLINYKSSLLLPKAEDILKVQELTKNYTVYFWFSDIPIYERRHLNDFLAYIGFYDLASFLPKNEWLIFEYVVYAYYVMLYKDYKLVNIRDHGLVRNFSLESMPYDFAEKVSAVVGYKPLWLAEAVFKEHAERELCKHAVMSYHKDRGLEVDF
jgi:hypothetical protein